MGVASSVGVGVGGSIVAVGVAVGLGGCDRSSRGRRHFHCPGGDMDLNLTVRVAVIPCSDVSASVPALLVLLASTNSKTISTNTVSRSVDMVSSLRCRRKLRLP